MDETAGQCSSHLIRLLTGHRCRDAILDYSLYTLKWLWVLGLKSGIRLKIESGIGFAAGLCVPKWRELEVALYAMGTDWLCTQRCRVALHPALSAILFCL